MLDPVTLALALAGSIIVIGFLGNYFFERTGFPDMIFLIILGMLVGPVTKLVDTEQFIMPLAPYFAALALVFILFDGGMAMNIYRVFTESPRATVLAVGGFGLSVAATTLFAALLLMPDKPVTYSLLLGTILGGSSSIVVISLASKIGVSEKCSTILSLESALTDILCIVFSLTIIEIILGSAVEPISIGQAIASKFSIGIVLGIFFGLLWLSVLKKIVKAPYAYILTLAVVLLSYAVSETLGGSGALCCLLFGIVLGNEKEIYRMLRMERPTETVIDAGLKRFESEVAFLLRTFFFVYIGLISTISDVKIALLGIILSFILLLARFGAVRLATARCSELAEERPIMSVILTRGLAAAVLATLPLQYSEANPTFKELYKIYINIVVLVILVTAVIATIGIPIIKWRAKKG
ncbi:MAG: cation:proton antiporter [Candidatus Bathyarchaeia archaeon]